MRKFICQNKNCNSVWYSSSNTEEICDKCKKGELKEVPMEEDIKKDHV